jgi:hypothetical protein
MGCSCGRSVRNIYGAHGVSLMVESSQCALVRVPETPPDLPLEWPHSGGVLVGEPNRLIGVGGGGDYRLEKKV